MNEDFPRLEFDNLDKEKVFNQALSFLAEKNFHVIDSDMQRPWGFFISVNEEEAPQFIDMFYHGIDLKGIDVSLPLRPKILGIQNHRRLSLQKHDRRAEIWRGIGGHFHVIMGPGEDSLKQHLIEPGQTVVLPQGIIHRGAGLDGWALVAEIWQHNDPAHPSDEDDITRLQDDFGR